MSISEVSLPNGKTLFVDTSKLPTTEKQRTPNQNNALHQWLDECAEVMTEAGIEQTHFLEMLHERGVEMPFTKESLKVIFRYLMDKVYDKDSTAKASTTEYNTIQEGLAKLVAQKYGVALPSWPDRFRGDEA